MYFSIVFAFAGDSTITRFFGTALLRAVEIALGRDIRGWSRPPLLDG
jgi:hypothetical protein